MVRELHRFVLWHPGLVSVLCCGVERRVSFWSIRLSDFFSSYFGIKALGLLVIGSVFHCLLLLFYGRFDFCGVDGGDSEGLKDFQE